MALIALTAMGCSKEDSVPAGGSPMTFTGVAPAASVPASAASSRSYFPGTSGLMYWSDYDNIGAYAFDSSKALKAHDICTLQSGAGSGLAVFHPRNILYSESWSGSGDYTFYAYYPVWTAAAATYSRRGRVVEHPFGPERRVRTLSGLLLAGRHRKFRVDQIEQVRPLRLQACFVVDAGAVVP